MDRQGGTGLQYGEEAHRKGPQAGGVNGAERSCRKQLQWEWLLRELMEYLAKALVDEPEQVNVTEVEGERVTVIELRVAQSDLGKVIGKQGRTARALRTILNANATKLKKRAVLEIVE